MTEPIDVLHDQIPLSPAGAIRRDAMLGELIGEVHRVRRGRQRRRAAGAAGALVLAVVAIGVPASMSRTSDVSGPLVQHQAPDTRAGTDTATIIVATDPSILDRYVVPTGPTPRAILADDASLLAELASIDRPAGIIRTAGRVWVTRDVVDEI